MVWEKADEPTGAVPSSTLPFPTHVPKNVGGKMKNSSHVFGPEPPRGRKGKREINKGGEQHRRHQGAVILQKARLPRNQTGKTRRQKYYFGAKNARNKQSLDQRPTRDAD